MREKILQPRGVSASLERHWSIRKAESGARGGWFLYFRENGADIPNAERYIRRNPLLFITELGWWGGDGKWVPQKEFSSSSLSYYDLFS